MIVSSPFQKLQRIRVVSMQQQLLIGILFFFIDVFLFFNTFVDVKIIGTESTPKLKTLAFLDVSARITAFIGVPLLTFLSYF